MEYHTGTTQYYQIISSNLGWSCPKCGCVYSPTTTECYRCNNNEQTKSTFEYETEELNNNGNNKQR